MGLFWDAMDTVEVFSFLKLGEPHFQPDMLCSCCKLAIERFCNTAPVTATPTEAAFWINELLLVCLDLTCVGCLSP